MTGRFFRLIYFCVALVVFLLAGMREADAQRRITPVNTPATVTQPKN